MKLIVALLIVLFSLNSCNDNYDYNWDERVRCPNTFSPNHDGRNETWCIDSEGVTECILVITDQDGMELWRTTDIDSCWDPTTTLSSNLYYYFLHATFSDGTSHDYSGEIMIIY